MFFRRVARRTRFLHPEGQDQAHRRFRAGQAVVGVLEPDHFFGEGCLNGHPLRVTTATAIDQCLITRITKAAMIATLHDESEFSQLFMADLLSRNSRIEEDLIDQLLNSSEKRLARTLLLLANFGKEATVEPIIGKFSQETLAEMIGTTRSRVSFFMNKFRKLGYIEYNGKLEIRNSLLNVVLYDKPEIRENDAPKDRDSFPRPMSASGPIAAEMAMPALRPLIRNLRHDPAAIHTKKADVLSISQ